MPDYSVDFDTIISNAERTFALKADDAARRAADPDIYRNYELQKNALSDFDKDVLKRDCDRQKAEFESESRTWRARQAVAKEGYLLITQDDQRSPGFMLAEANQTLHAAASKAGRIRFIGSIADLDIGGSTDPK